jgi:hypothetical protein
LARIFAFDELGTADLHVDCTYKGGNSLAQEPLHAMFKCGIGGGFRYKRIKNGRYLLVVLFSSGSDPDWPDRLDPETGLFVYYGDNRRPGDLHKKTR